MLFRKEERTAVEDYIVCEGGQTRNGQLLPISWSRGTNHRFYIHAACQRLGDCSHQSHAGHQKAKAAAIKHSNEALQRRSSTSCLQLNFKTVTTLGGVKATFFQKATDIPKHTLQRLAYEKIQESFVMQTLRLQLPLPSTSSSEQLLIKGNGRERNDISYKGNDEQRMDKSQPQPKTHTIRKAVHGLHQTCRRKSIPYMKVAMQTV